ncbi:unnamed protein product [Amoebophrya sp. A25]|nr:unnamed protein product [Amoebophrya sp. A25]|eukprot:GSA25T00004152001.1
MRASSLERICNPASTSIPISRQRILRGVLKQALAVQTELQRKYLHKQSGALWRIAVSEKKDILYPFAWNNFAEFDVSHFMDMREFGGRARAKLDMATSSTFSISCMTKGKGKGKGHNAGGGLLGSQAYATPRYHEEEKLMGSVMQDNNENALLGLGQIASSISSNVNTKTLFPSDQGNQNNNTTSTSAAGAAAASSTVGSSLAAATAKASSSSTDKNNNKNQLNAQGTSETTSITTTSTNNKNKKGKAVNKKSNKEAEEKEEDQDNDDVADEETARERAEFQRLMELEDFQNQKPSKTRKTGGGVSVASVAASINSNPKAAPKNSVSAEVNSTTTTSANLGMENTKVESVPAAAGSSTCTKTGFGSSNMHSTSGGGILTTGARADSDFDYGFAEMRPEPYHEHFLNMFDGFAVVRDDCWIIRVPTWYCSAGIDLFTDKGVMEGLLCDSVAPGGNNLKNITWENWEYPQLNKEDGASILQKVNHAAAFVQVVARMELCSQFVQKYKELNAFDQRMYMEGEFMADFKALLNQVRSGDDLVAPTTSLKRFQDMFRVWKTSGTPVLEKFQDVPRPLDTVFFVLSFVDLGLGAKEMANAVGVAFYKQAFELLKETKVDWMLLPMKYYQLLTCYAIKSTTNDDNTNATEFVLIIIFRLSQYQWSRKRNSSRSTRLSTFGEQCACALAGGFEYLGE